MMRDPITDAAQDPSCILAVTPDRGGSWWSRLRPPMPRNFEEEPETWQSLQEAWQSCDWSHDFSMRGTVKTTNPAAEQSFLYCVSSRDATPFSLRQSADGDWYVYSSLGRTQGSQATVFNMKFPAELTGTNDAIHFEFLVEGESARLVVDGFAPIVTQIDRLTPSLASVPYSSAGYITTLAFTDLTTGETVWQASYAELYAIYEPHNFAVNAHAFYDCQAVVQEAIDPTHDYSFLIETEIVRENQECSVFYAGGDKFPFGVYSYSDNTIRVFSNVLRSAIDTSSKYATVIAYSGDTRLQGRHTIELRIEGDAMRVFLDGNEIEHPYTFVRTGTITVGPPNCNSGYVYKIQIEDLTTGRTVWQAAYSDLYDMLPPPPWPSSVPRDFAEETKTWYDFQNMQLAADWTHDYTFECTFMLHTRDTPAPVLYVDASSQMFGVYQYRDNTIGLFTTLFKPTASAGKYLAYIITTENATIFWESYHTVKIVVNGNSTSFYIDNELIRTFSSNYERTLKADLNLAAPATKTGYIGNCFIQDDTIGKIVWSYPNEAERVRLLTKTNIRTDRGVFEAADDTKVAGIATQLDLRGNTTSKTFIVRAFCPAHDPASNRLYLHPLIGQGNIGSGATGFTFHLSIREDRQSGLIQVYPVVSNGRVFYSAYADASELLDSWHVFAFSIEHLPESTVLRSFVDGVQVGGSSAPAFAWGTPTDTTTQETTVGIRRDPNMSFYAGSLTRISYALVFDRALSAAEIAALTPKKQLLSWAGIQDVVRSGRAQRYFAVGDVLTVATPRWTIEYEVVGFDQVEPADAALTHSMTLLPVRLVTAVQFDAPEPGNQDANRAKYGCNRWDWSALRQWLNSAAAPGEWWTAQHEYDAAPNYAATMAGFMSDLPTDFLSAVAPARLVTALPNTDGGGSVETVDRFWLPSRTEIFGDTNEDGIVEGVQMTKYIDATDADRIKYNAAGTATIWWLRTHTYYAVVSVRSVDASGSLNSNSVISTCGIVPACIIA